MATVAELTAQKQQLIAAYERGEISKTEYAQAMSQTQMQINRLRGQRVAASRQAAKAPLPPSYWRSGAEVPGAQPYVSGKVAPPVFVAPPGYAVQEVKPTERGLEVSLEPVEQEVPTSLFGPKISYYDPATGTMTEELTTREGKQVYVTTKPATVPEVFSGKATISPHTQQAVLGLSLATTTGMGVAVPMVGAFAIGGVTVAEVGKVTITGEHLTVPEAISAAGISEILGVGFMAGARFLRPRVERGLEASYRAAIERGELWKASLLQRISMKITGAQPPRLAQELVGAGEPRGVSFSMLRTGKVNLEESYFWDFPTPRTAQVYLRSPEPHVKAWAVGTLVKRVYLEGLFTTTLRTGLITETVKPLKPKMPYIPKEPYITKAAEVTPLPITFTSLGLMIVPRMKTIQVTKQTTRKSLFQTSRQVEVISQVLGASQMQRQAQQQKQILGLKQTQVQTQTQRIIQKQMLGTPAPTPTVTIPKAAMLYLPRGGGEAGSRIFDRLFGKWFPRKHKVKTWEQMLGTFGLKAPKRLAKLGKMEVPKGFSGFGKGFKLGAPKKKRGKSKKRKKKRGRKKKR